MDVLTLGTAAKLGQLVRGLMIPVVCLGVPASAMADTPPEGVGGLLPAEGLPEGSTPLLYGFQIQHESSEVTVEVDGNPVAVTVGDPLGRPLENLAMLTLDPAPTVGQTVTITVPDADPFERIVGPEDLEPPSSPENPYLVLSGALEDDGDLSGDFDFDLEYEVEPSGGGAWEGVSIRMYVSSNPGVTLAHFFLLTSDPGHLEYTPPAYKLAGKDPAEVCFELSTLDGAGRVTTSIESCVDEDNRGRTGAGDDDDGDDDDDADDDGDDDDADDDGDDDDDDDDDAGVVDDRADDGKADDDAAGCRVDAKTHPSNALMLLGLLGIWARTRRR